MLQRPDVKKTPDYQVDPLNVYVVGLSGYRHVLDSILPVSSIGNRLHSVRSNWPIAAVPLVRVVPLTIYLYNR